MPDAWTCTTLPLSCSAALDSIVTGDVEVIFSGPLAVTSTPALPLALIWPALASIVIVPVFDVSLTSALAVTSSLP
jgi:hypothetical protein